MIIRKYKDIYQVLSKETWISRIKDFLKMKNKYVLFESDRSVIATQWATDNSKDYEPIIIKCTIVVGNGEVLTSKRKPLVYFDPPIQINLTKRNK